MTPRETENNAYAKFWIDQQRVCYAIFCSGQFGITMLNLDFLLTPAKS